MVWRSAGRPTTEQLPCTSPPPTRKIEGLKGNFRQPRLLQLLINCTFQPFQLAASPPSYNRNHINLSQLGIILRQIRLTQTPLTDGYSFHTNTVNINRKGRRQEILKKRTQEKCFQFAESRCVEGGGYSFVVRFRAILQRDLRP